MPKLVKEGCNRLCDLQWMQPSKSRDLLQPSLQVGRISNDGDSRPQAYGITFM